MGALKALLIAMPTAAATNMGTLSVSRELNLPANLGQRPVGQCDPK